MSFTIVTQVRPEEDISTWSLEKLEEEHFRIMAVSGFVIPPRALELQAEIDKRMNHKINLSSAYGRFATGGVRREDFFVVSAETDSSKSAYTTRDQRVLNDMFSRELQSAIDRDAVEQLIAYAEPSPFVHRIKVGQFDMNPLVKYKSNYYNPSPLDKLSADMEGFDGSATDWFNEQYLQTATKPQPQMVRKTVDYLGLLEPPRGIDPVDLEIGREKNLAYMRQYVKSMEDAMKSLKESIADIKPAFIAAKAPSAEDIRKVRDYIFDDSIKFMYPTTIQPLDTMIGISTPVAANAVLDVEMPKKRDVFYVDVLKGV